MQKLKASEIAQHRAERLAAQGGRCALCCDPIGLGEAVLDHDHKTGKVRAVLHRGCNSALGHIENNRARYLLKGARLGRMLRAAFDYIHSNYDDNPIHPTHRTDTEKKERANAKARKRRAVQKAGA